MQAITRVAAATKSFARKFDDALPQIVLNYCDLYISLMQYHWPWLNIYFVCPFREGNYAWISKLALACTPHCQNSNWNLYLPLVSFWSYNVSCLLTHAWSLIATRAIFISHTHVHMRVLLFLCNGLFLIQRLARRNCFKFVPLDSSISGMFKSGNYIMLWTTKFLINSVYLKRNLFKRRKELKNSFKRINSSSL